MASKDVKPVISVGAFTYGHQYAKIHHWGEGTSLTIGRFCSIGRGMIIFLGGNHRMDFNSTFPFQKMVKDWRKGRKIEAPATTSRGDVHIGNDVWIGENVTILSGVTIGDGAVLGTHAVVTRDVDSYDIVAGNPARRIGARPVSVHDLLFLRWWDWPDEIIGKAVPYICAQGIQPLIDFYCRWQEIDLAEYEARRG